MSIDVAVIGCGYRGRELVRNLEAVESLNLVAVCDVIQNRVEEIQRDHPQVMISTDFESVLQDRTIDAVAVATPISTHYGITKRALRGNKHVFVEVPLAMRSEEVEELLFLSQKTGKVLMVDDPFLYSGKVLAMKDLVNKDELGNLYYIDAVRTILSDLKPMKRSTGFCPDAGVIWDLAPHDVAIMTSLIDADPIRVSTSGANPVAYCSERWPIMAWGVVWFESGVVGHFHVNWLAPETVERMTIVGSKKMVVYDELRPNDSLTLYDKGIDLIPISPDRDAFGVRYREGETIGLSWEPTEPLCLAVEHFRNCILEGREFASNAAYALRVVSVLEAAERSISLNGEPVEIKLHSMTGY